MSSSSWFITGSNRGIGLGLVRHLSADSKNIILASCRDISKAGDLLALADSAECKAQIFILKLDSKDEESIKSAAGKANELLGEKRLDYLINNAAAQTSNAKAFGIDTKTFLDDIKVNTLGPALIAKAFLPLLERPSENSRPPTILNLSSGLASIGLKYGAKEAEYSMTKAALNMLTYKQAAEKPNIIAICLDPGWVKTDMGGPNAMITVEESVQSIMNVLSSATTKDSGSFKHYTGKDLPW